MAKFVSLDRIESAIKNLPSYPPAVIAFLAMKKAGVRYDRLVDYGSTQENQFLNEYFKADGAPPGKGFFIPFSKDGWVSPDYSGKTLQRARSSKNPEGYSFANGLKHVGNKFQFEGDVTDNLSGRFPKDGDEPRRINIYDLLAWLRRHWEFSDEADLEELVQHFKDEFHLSDKEFDSLFVVPPANAEENFFAPTNHEQNALVRVLGGRIAGIKLDRPESELLDHLEQFISGEGHFLIPPHFIRRFYHALKAQNFVILTGKPGTGKTQFVDAFIRGLMDFFKSNDVHEVFLAVSAEYTEVNVIGYENLEGRHVTTDFVDKFINADTAKERRGLFFLVLDEFNLAHPDRYLARLLPAIESDHKVILPAQQSAYLPSDTFVVATANSYLDESTRLPLSGPILRRAHLIEMPNVLTEELGKDEAAFVNVLTTLAEQTNVRLTERNESRGDSFLDAQREGALEAFIDDPNILSQELRSLLREICTTFSADPVSALTMGVLQDALDYIIMAGSSKESVDEAIAQKLLPQLRGNIDAVEKAHEILAAAEMTESARYASRLADHADPVTREIQPLA